MSIEDTTLFLQRHPIFQRLGKADLDFLAEHTESVSYSENDLIFREGDTADAFFIVLEGQVGLFTKTGRHDAMLVHSVDPDELLGLSWIVPPYTWEFDAKALHPSILMRFDGKAIRARCEQDPVFGYATMRRVCELMLHRLHGVRSYMAERISELEYHTDSASTDTQDIKRS